MSKGNNTGRALKKAVITGTRLIRKYSLLNFTQAEKEIKDLSDEPIVAVDVMGGDFAPVEIVKGAVRAASELGIHVQLVGPLDRISRELSKYDIKNLPIEIVEATDFISMEDKQPALAIRRKPNSSIMVATAQVANGKAHAVVSAGSTGAAATAAIFHLKRISGIERPGIACVIPTTKQSMILIDAGGNVDSTPSQMAQHAMMGSLFAIGTLGIDSPRVGMLNIGEEAGKGNAATKLGFEALQNLQTINFVGNVEGRTLSENYCDVLVADGFVGNVFLKTLEGAIKMCFQMMHQELTSSLDLKMGAMICKPAFRKIKNERLNYAKYGGAVLLGVNGVVVIAHGISNDFAIMNAIKLGAETAKSQIVEKIKVALKSEQNDETSAQSPIENHSDNHSDEKQEV